MKQSTLRRYLANMPPLDHYPNRDSGEPFRWEDSEVFQWLMANTRVPTRLFEALRESGAIIFDPETKTWRGYKTPLSHAVVSRQNRASSKSSILNTEPSSNTQHHIYDMGVGDYDDDRLSPNPLTADVRNDDDGQSLEVQP